MNAICTDFPAGYECACREGFVGNGYKCKELVNECATGAHDCHRNAICTDLRMDSCVNVTIRTGSLAMVEFVKDLIMSVFWEHTDAILNMVFAQIPLLHTLVLVKMVSLVMDTTVTDRLLVLGQQQ